MEYKIFELKNRLRSDKSISGIIDYASKVNNDIVDVSPCTVNGSCSYNEYKEMFTFTLHVNETLTMLSAVTLNPIKVLVDFDTELFYTFKVTDDDSFPIVGDTIGLDEEIWGEIMLHLPLRIVEEGVEFSEADNFVPEKDSPFSSLGEEKEEEE